MAGMTLTDRHIVIKDPIDIRSRSFVENFGVLRHKYYSIYDPMNSIIDDLLASPTPDILRSMPSDLSNLVQTARSRGIRLPKPKAIFSDSETLDSPTREAIEGFFNVPLLDFYANTETGIAAFQTPTSNGRYLIPEDFVLLETVKNPKLTDGDMDIVLTGLVNKTTPIIRYRIGDVSDGSVEREPTSAYSSIKSVHGKYLDFLVRTDGSIVSSHAAKQNLTHLPGIKRFQVKQDEIGTVVIRIQKAEDWSPQTEVQIRQDFARDFGSTTTVLIEFVADLSKDVNNYRKFKVIESSVSQQLLTAVHTEAACPDDSIV
jgi:phenylacetate-coenzyme A ligase PaaK-like adenylate-forming protein